jgi:hypothetical protein
MYDAETGRWFGVDPQAEDYLNWSPYNYVLGNPVNHIDPNGEFVLPFIVKTAAMFILNYASMQMGGPAFAGTSTTLGGGQNGNSLQANFSGPEDPPGAQLDEGVCYKNVIPVAKMYSLDLDYFVTGGMDAQPIGFIVVLQGPDAGKVAAFGDIGYIGGGVDISASIKETNLWYTGDIDNFRISTIEGYRREINGALSYGADLGLSLSWTKTDAYGGRLFGLGVSVGVSPPMPWLGSGNYNEGKTYIYKVW